MTSALSHVSGLRLGCAPCAEAIAWLDGLPAGTTPQQAWDTCPRADWMLWYAEATGVHRVTLTRCSCACARTALRFVPAGEDRLRIAIETAEAWCDGRATEEEVAAAGDAAGDARVAAWDVAWVAAWDAAWAAAGAAAWAAAGDAARAAAGAAARAAAGDEMAVLVRGIIPNVPVLREHQQEVGA